MAVRNPPNLDARIRADEQEFQRRTAAILVTNNPLGEGHIPYADDPRQGMLGLYVANSPRWQDLLEHGARACCSAASPPTRCSTIGWRRRSTSRLPAETVNASVDGEIVSLKTPLRCRLHRGGLSVLKPPLQNTGRTA